MNQKANQELKVYPIKELLLKSSYLVKFNQKETSGQSLTQSEQKQQNRIYEQRDKVFANIRQALSKYYEVAINGNYRYDGRPEIKKGIAGWMEAKVWKLLVCLGEPNHLRYFTANQDFWTETE